MCLLSDLSPHFSWVYAPSPVFPSLLDQSHQYASLLQFSPSLKENNIFSTPATFLCSPLQLTSRVIYIFCPHFLSSSFKSPQLSLYLLHSIEIALVNIPRAFLLLYSLGVSQSSFLLNFFSSFWFLESLSPFASTFFVWLLRLRLYSQFSYFSGHFSSTSHHHFKSLKVDVSRALNILNRCSHSISRL